MATPKPASRAVSPVNTNTGVAKRNETAVARVMPSFLTQFVDDGSTDALKEYRVIPRLKIVQGSSRQELKSQYPEGSVLLMPGPVGVAEPKGSFLFVPLFFYPEYIKWRDIGDKSGNAIIERTLDKTSPLADVCRDPNRREESYDNPEKPQKPFTYRYVEHMCFVGVVYGDNTPVVVSFQRGEFNVGRSFSSLIGMRRFEGRQAPLWAQIYELTSAPRHRNSYDWYGLDVQNAEKPWIEEGEMEIMKDLHDQLKADYEKGNLQTNRADEEVPSEEEVVVDQEL